MSMFIYIDNNFIDVSMQYNQRLKIWVEKWGVKCLKESESPIVRRRIGGGLSKLMGIIKIIMLVG